MQTLTPNSIEMSWILKLRHTDKWTECATLNCTHSDQQLQNEKVSLP
jgi:hypothetical protein